MMAGVGMVRVRGRGREIHIPEISENSGQARGGVHCRMFKDKGL